MISFDWMLWWKKQVALFLGRYWAAGEELGRRVETADEIRLARTRRHSTELPACGSHEKDWEATERRERERPLEPRGCFLGTKGEGTELVATQKVSELTAISWEVRTPLWGQVGKGTAVSKCSYFYSIVPSHTEFSWFKEYSNSDSSKIWLLV